MDKIISVIPWAKAKEMLPQECRNKEIIYLLDTIYSNQSKEKNYVYHIKLKFGDYLIDKGNRYCFEDAGFSIKSNINDIIKTRNDFISDLDYTVDPLGMVTRNFIEVYSENEILKGGTPIDKYRVHLNLIRAGELFGIYGTLDFLTKCNSSHNAQTWYTIAGNSCFELLFPFNNKTHYGFMTADSNPNKDILNKQIAINTDNKVNFFSKYINICDATWGVDIIYFPKHIINTNNTNFRIKLFEEGWLQSKTSRNSAFDNKHLHNIIHHVDKISSLKYNKYLLNIILDYIIKSTKGETYVLKPLSDDKHILNMALNKFKDDISDYVNRKNSYTPIIMHYDKIINENDWGCLSIDKFPILKKYPQIKLNTLQDDLNNIKMKVPSLFIPQFYMTANTGIGGEGGRIKGKRTLEKNICNTLGLTNGNVYLTAKGLSNFIVINKKIEF